jgi:hypothetical protein
MQYRSSRKGKDMKVLEEVCRHKDINACKDTKIETKLKSSSLRRHRQKLQSVMESPRGEY